MKKTIAAALAVLMLGGLSVGAVTPAEAASVSVHVSAGVHPAGKVIVRHHKHWRQHLVCKTKWRHHHRVKVCFWVPNHR